MLTFLDFFAGIGGFRRGMELAGHKCVGFCEFDKFALASYTAMHLMTDQERDYIATLPKNRRVKEAGKEGYRHGEWYAADIRRIFAEDIPRADCWCFGFPCQDISVAGKQLGFRGHRSSLFFRVMRLVQDLEEKDRPTYLFLENVKNLLSVNGGTDFLKLLLALDESGYDAEWQVINSDGYVPQNRERVFLMGHLRGRCTEPVFPVEGTDGENTIHRIGEDREPYIAFPAFCDLSYRAGLRLYDKAFCLQSRYHKGVCGRKKGTSGIALIAKVNDSQDGRVFGINGISQCLSAGHNNKPKIAVPVLAPDRGNKKQNGRRMKENGDPMFTLTGQDRHGVMVEMPDGGFAYGVWYEKYGCYVAIRRLTPKECFRLQGWEDSYFERAALVNSESQLYKQAGNGVTVPVIERIAERMG